jgi:hypothetical protein
MLSRTSNASRIYTRHGVTSKHNLQSQQSQWQTDKSQLDAVHFKGQAIYNEALLNWGKKLAEWVVSTDSDKLNDFLSDRQTLLQIILPANTHLPDDIQTIYIEPSGFRSSANKARLISVAPQTDIPTQGESYFFPDHRHTHKNRHAYRSMDT